MNSQYRQLEKIHLQTLPQEHEREIRQISLAKEACRGKRGIMCILLTALGFKMVQLGSQLLARYGELGETELIRKFQIELR